MTKDVIGICSDHAGYEMKEHLKRMLEDKGMEYADFGTHSSDSCDYPDFAHQLGNAIDKGECSRGIAICATGNGISMTLNKHSKVRAALCWNESIAALTRQHNDANVLSLPARFMTFEEADKIMETFFSSDFEGGRHKRRIDKIPISI